MLEVQGFGEDLWHPPGGRWRGFRRQRRRDRGPVGPKRGGQDHQFPHGLRHDRGRCRQGDAPRHRRDPLAMYRRAREQGMGYLAQESSVFRKLTVEKNLLGVMEMLGFDRKLRARRCKELLEQFDIPGSARPLALSLSGGERRRLEIARGGLQPQNHPFGRAVHGHRSGDHRQHSEDHPPAARGRDRRVDHRPPGPRDVANHRSQLRDPGGQGAVPRPPRRSAGQSRGPRYYFGEDMEIGTWSVVGGQWSVQDIAGPCRPGELRKARLARRGPCSRDAPAFLLSLSTDH